MTEIEKLQLHLKNLKEQGHTEFPVNVSWLLKVLEHLPTNSNPNLPPSGFDVDAGKF